MSTFRFSEIVRAAAMATAMQLLCLAAAALLLGTFASMCFYSKAHSRDDGLKANRQSSLRE
jgi:hypothetical protein